MLPNLVNETIQNNIDHLFSSILHEQQKINTIRKASKDKKDLIKDYLENFSKNRGRNYFFKYLSSGRGHGPFTELIDGSVKYDLINGIGFNLLGHSHPLMIRAALDAATSDTLFCGNLQPYPEAGELSETIIQSVQKSRLKHFWFAGSGSFANDLALKILWQKKAPSYNLIAFKNAFAGRSVATQDITDKESYREGMPQKINVRHAPHYNQEKPDKSLEITLNHLNKIWNEGPNSFCGIMIELIQGEAGFVYGPPDFYKGIFNWAKSKGLYIWVDEVQTFGRTRELFAFQMLGLDEYVDIVTVAKALHTGGILYTEELNPKPGLIAGTFNGTLAALKMGQSLVKYLREGPFYGSEGRIHEIEKIFMTKLENIQTKFGCEKLPYFGGVGTMISFEIGDSGLNMAKRFVQKLFENGIMAFTAGSKPARVRFLLPVCLTHEHIDEIFSLLEKTLIDFF